MNRKILLIFVFLAFGSRSILADGSHFVMGTNLVSQLYWVIGANLCQLMHSKNAGFECLAEKSDGSVANVWGLKEGLFDIALAGKDTVERMYKGDPENGVNPISSLRLIMPLYVNKFTIITNPQSKIGTPNDLKGKKIDIGVRGSESYRAFKDFMKIKGWTDKDFGKIYASEPFTQKSNLLKNKVDAITIFEGSPNSWVWRILDVYPGHILSLDAQDISALSQKFKNYIPVTMDAKMYPNNNYVIQTFGTEVYLVATESTNPDIIYTFLKTVDQNMYELKKTHPVLADVYTYNVKREKPIIPLHLGAERYLIERGIL